MKKSLTLAKPQFSMKSIFFLTGLFIFILSGPSFSSDDQKSSESENKNKKIVVNHPTFEELTEDIMCSIFDLLPTHAFFVLSRRISKTIYAKTLKLWQTIDGCLFDLKWNGLKEIEKLGGDYIPTRNPFPYHNLAISLPLSKICGLNDKASCLSYDEEPLKNFSWPNCLFSNLKTLLLEPDYLPKAIFQSLLDQLGECQQLKILYLNMGKNKVQVKDPAESKLSLKKLFDTSPGFPILTQLIISGSGEVVSYDADTQAVPSDQTVASQMIDAKELASYVTHQTKLEKLEIIYNPLGDIGVDALSNSMVSGTHQCLTQIDLTSSISKATPTTLEKLGSALSSLPMKALYLSSNGLSAKALESLFSKLKRDGPLEDLHLGRNSLKGDLETSSNLFDFLSKLKYLKYLDLHAADMEDQTLALFAKKMTQSQSIASLDLRENGFENPETNNLELIVRDCLSLTVLDLSETTLENGGVSVIVKALKNRTSPNALKVLSLDSCSIKHEGFLELLTALNDFSSLTELALSNNPLHLSENDADQENFANPLKNNTTLKKLCVDNPFLSDGEDGSEAEGFYQDIANALMENTTLTSLSINSSPLDQSDHIRSIIQSNTTLTELDMSLNFENSPKEHKKIAEAIGFNHTLRSIDLGHIYFDFDDQKILFQSLKKSITLIDLSLNGTTIGESEGSFALLKEFVINHSMLQYLDLCSNKINRENRQSLIEERRPHLKIAFQ